MRSDPERAIKYGMRVCLCHSKAKANKLLLVCRICISVFLFSSNPIKVNKVFSYISSLSYFYLHGLVVRFVLYFAPAESLLDNNE